MKVHKIPMRDWNRARIFKMRNGFWNPAMTTLEVSCGCEPTLITPYWRLVDCKRCLAKRPKKAKVRK